MSGHGLHGDYGINCPFNPLLLFFVTRNHILEQPFNPKSAIAPYFLFSGGGGRDF